MGMTNYGAFVHKSRDKRFRLIFLAGPAEIGVRTYYKPRENFMSTTYYVVPEEVHDNLVFRAYRERNYTEAETRLAVKFTTEAARHGIRTHNAIKALHLDDLFGSKTGGCVPGAEIEVRPTRFEASQVWDANKKLGQAVAYRAMDTCMKLADEFGIGQVAVDNAFHYLWGGGYMIYAAQRGYLAYTNCTSALAEVVPFMGKYPTLGTNPHSWGFPTQESVGFPVVIDWATSTVAMGRVQQFKREGKELPPNAAVDENGNPTTDPNKAVALLPFGAHKGYGLGLINEMLAGLIGGSLPTIRGRKLEESREKNTASFYFQVIHPEALNNNDFAKGRSQAENLEAVVRDILGHGNENCMLPGQIEAEAAKLSAEHGGLLFTAAEIESFNEIARECGEKEWDRGDFASVEV
jgi:L-2-hydroxycarboxylate dehydrogenase (NAD+)